MDPEDMSGGTGHPGGEEQIPEAWVGRRVEVVVVRSGGYDQATYGTRPLAGEYGNGVLDVVNDRGIVASLSFYEDEEPTRSVFYPWGAVLSMQLEEE